MVRILSKYHQRHAEDYVVYNLLCYSSWVVGMYLRIVNELFLDIESERFVCSHGEKTLIKIPVWGSIRQVWAYMDGGSNYSWCTSN
jgi:hypothetical protein